MPLLPPQIRAPNTVLIIGLLSDMLEYLPKPEDSQHFSRDRSPGCHNSEVTRLQESLDLFSELLDGDQLVPGKLNGPLLSCSSQI